ncbi:MAG: glycosyl hydrolase, partial [Ignavibacteria bacterium]
NLLFAGTEFGIFFTLDGGEKWIQLKSGIPDVAVRDIAIQKRESDLVLATFGRGFYVLDDYSALREVNKDLLNKDGHIFPLGDVLMYMQTSGKYGQGSTYFKAPNPPFGATFTYYVKDVPKTLKQIRKKKEKELFKKGEPIPQPSYDDLRKEKAEVSPYLLFTIKDESGNVVRKLTKPASKGIKRITWDLRYYSSAPKEVDKFNPTKRERGSTLVLPGKYSVEMALVNRDGMKQLAGPVWFETKVLRNSTLPQADRNDLVAFQKKANELARVMRGTERFTQKLIKRVESLRQALLVTPAADFELLSSAEKIAKELDDVMFKFNGQPSKASQEEVPPQHVPLRERLGVLAYTHWRSTAPITQTEQTAYDVLVEEFPPVLDEVKRIYTEEIIPLENKLEDIAGPWTPGRIPVWHK